MQEAAERFLIDPDTGEIIQEFPYPWPHFRQELEARLSRDPAAAMEQLKYPILTPEDREIKPIFVSRMPRHKVTGAAHLETVKSGKLLNEGLLIAKKALTSPSAPNANALPALPQRYAPICTLTSRP